VFEQCEKHTIPATFFELTCALAFVAFGRAQCDAVVLEVGLGGRLDSTNVITPQLCVITSIQLDHTKILGDTIDKIAMEKAGIMKPGVDVLVGPGCPIELLRAEAKRVGAPFYTLSDVLQPTERTYTEPNRDADFADIDNLNTDISRAALRLLRRSSSSSISSSAVAAGSSSGASTDKLAKLAAALAVPGMEDGLQKRPPCRFEVFPQTLALGGPQSPLRVDAILDIAHNEDAMVALARKVAGLYPSPPGGARPVRVVLGMSSDKDVHKCLAPVLRMVHGQVDRVTCVAARHPRAIKQAELRQLLSAHSAAVPASEVTHDASASDTLPVREAVANAVRAVAEEAAALAAAGRPAPTPVVVVCGTAFIMAEARAAVGVVEPRDGDTLTDAIALASAGIASTTPADSNADAQEFFGDNVDDKRAAL
jgi:dihydrofolate synthase/folylpolyglutamate synthase